MHQFLGRVYLCTDPLTSDCKRAKANMPKSKRNVLILGRVSNAVPQTYFPI